MEFEKENCTFEIVGLISKSVPFDNFLSSFSKFIPWLLIVRTKNLDDKE